MNEILHVSSKGESKNSALIVGVITAINSDHTYEMVPDGGSKTITVGMMGGQCSPEYAVGQVVVLIYSPVRGYIELDTHARYNIQTNLPKELGDELDTGDSTASVSLSDHVHTGVSYWAEWDGST